MQSVVKMAYNTFNHADIVQCGAFEGAYPKNRHFWKSLELQRKMLWRPVTGDLG